MHYGSRSNVGVHWNGETNSGQRVWPRIPSIGHRWISVGVRGLLEGWVALEAAHDGDQSTENDTIQECNGPKQKSKPSDTVVRVLYE